MSTTAGRIPSHQLQQRNIWHMQAQNKTFIVPQRVQSHEECMYQH